MSWDCLEQGTVAKLSSPCPARHCSGVSRRCCPSPWPWGCPVGAPSSCRACAGVCHCESGDRNAASPTEAAAALPHPRRAGLVPVPVPGGGSSAGRWLGPAPPTVSCLQTTCNLGLKISEGEGAELVAHPEQGWGQVLCHRRRGHGWGSQPGRGGPCNPQRGFVGMMWKCGRLFSWLFLPCHRTCLGPRVSPLLRVTHVGHHEWHSLGSCLCPSFRWHFWGA